MFEPLSKLLDKHGTDFKEILKGILLHLTEIADNTSAKLEFDQFGDYSTSGKHIVELSNNEGGYWEVFCTGITRTGESRIGVYVGTYSPDSLVAVLAGKNLDSSTQKFYVPPRSTIYVVGEAEDEIHAHFQVRRLIERPQFTKNRSISYDVSEIDKRISEPERHRVPRTRKPSVDELRTSIHT